MRTFLLGDYGNIARDTGTNIILLLIFDDNDHGDALLALI